MPSDTTRMPEDAAEWEALFEHPKTGFVSLIGQAHSSDALKQIAQVVITQLLTRIGDKDHLKQHVSELQKLAKKDGDDVEKMRDEVVTLLREVKKECIAAIKPEASKPKPEKGKKAKKRKKKQKGKSSFSFGGILQKMPLPKKTHPGILIALLGLIIAGGVGAWFMMDGKASKALEADKKATVEFVRDYITKNRPAETWEIKSVEFKGEETIAVDVMLVDDRHVKMIVSKDAKVRRNFVNSLCPTYGKEVLAMLRRHWKIWISLRSDRFNITAGGCNYKKG